MESRDGPRAAGEVTAGQGEDDSSAPPAAPAIQPGPITEGVRIAAVEAAVAAGLAPSTSRSSATWVPPPAAGGDRLPDQTCGYALPDWSDPPTGQVPRVLRDEGETDDPESPVAATRRPTWRGGAGEWEDVDLSFLVEGGRPDGVAGNEVEATGDPFAFDFTAPTAAREARAFTAPTAAGGAGAERRRELDPGRRSADDDAWSELISQPVEVVRPTGDQPSSPRRRHARGHRAAWRLGSSAAGERRRPAAEPATRAAAPPAGGAAPAPVPPSGELARSLSAARAAPDLLTAELADLGLAEHGSRAERHPSAEHAAGLEHRASAEHAAGLHAASLEQGAHGAVGSGAGGAAARRSPLVAIATGTAFGLVALGCFFAGPLPSLVLIAVLVTLASGELLGALRRGGFRPAAIVALPAAPALIIAAYLRGVAALPLVLAVAVVVTWCSVLAERRRRAPAADLGVSMLAIVWVGLLGAFAGALLSPQVFAHRHGLGVLVAAVVLAAGNDVGAYATGARLGRHRLAPAVSPGKSWEGLAGGTVLTLVLGALVAARIHPLDIGTALVLAVAVCVLAPLGDLSESLIKRDLGLKDMGGLLPAHGGLLDRVDSLLFVLPAAYYLAVGFHLR